MRKKLLITLSLLVFMTNIEANPFYKSYKTQHNTPPFKSIKNEHYLPAFEKGIKENRAEIEAIANNSAKPTFENTILPMQFAGELLDRVSSVFFVLLSSESDDEMMDIAQEIQPQLTNLSNEIVLNKNLYERIKTIYNDRNNSNLSTEQIRLIEDIYRQFENNGATLSPEKQEEYKTLSTKLAQLTLQFGQNVLKYSNDYEFIITDANQLDGLPEIERAAAKEKATSKNEEGWLFDLSAPSYIGFMKYIQNRELREELYKAYNARNYNSAKYDNSEIVKEIAITRMEIAKLLGYEDYASYRLQNKMAKNKDNVYDLLNKLHDAYAVAAKSDVKEVQGFAIGTEGKNIEIQPWDWSFYSEKLKDAKYEINDSLVRPYFELENVKKGVFGLATDLYGLKFKRNSKIEVYHPEVEAFDVLDENGDFLAVLYTDFHPREGKRQGAWMTEFKGQYIDQKGKNSRPQVAIVMNFTRPTNSEPALLTYDEVNTFLHEFGHALHGMLAQSRYEAQSGTSVKHDFVELPSQLMENWLTEQEFLDKFAFHYKTGEKIPTELINKLVDAANFNEGYACYRQLSFGYLDMAWHSIQNSNSITDVEVFEKNAMQPTAILPTVDNTCMSTSFGHIFSGGYAAGYYGYKWAEVLDADAFAKFKETGIYNKETANSFRKNVLEKGDTEDPMTLYVRFRGQEPTVDALLERTGVK